MKSFSSLKAAKCLFLNEIVLLLHVIFKTESNIAKEIEIKKYLGFFS